MAWFTTVVALLFDVFPSVKSARSLSEPVLVGNVLTIFYPLLGFWYIKRTLFMIAMPVCLVFSSYRHTSDSFT